MTSCVVEKKRVLVTGATGLLGRAVVKEFASSGKWEVQGVGNTRAKGEILRVDLLDEDATSKIVESFKPDVILHAAAERRIDQCEKDPLARKLNVDVTRHLARLAKKHGAWLLFISTDYLFDGRAPPYSESSPLNPLNEYGRQKRDAGMAAREEDWGCGVLRVPLLYGDVEKLDESGASGLLAHLLDKVIARKKEKKRKKKSGNNGGGCCCRFFFFFF